MANTNYKGVSIGSAKVGGNNGFIVQGRFFKTIEEAKSSIDQKQASAATNTTNTNTNTNTTTNQGEAPAEFWGFSTTGGKEAELALKSKALKQDVSLALSINSIPAQHKKLVETINVLGKPVQVYEVDGFGKVYANGDKAYNSIDAAKRVIDFNNEYQGKPVSQTGMTEAEYNNISGNNVQPAQYSKTSQGSQVIKSATTEGTVAKKLTSSEAAAQAAAQQAEYEASVASGEDEQIVQPDPNVQSQTETEGLKPLPEGLPTDTYAGQTFAKKGNILIWDGKSFADMDALKASVRKYNEDQSAQGIGEKETKTGTFNGEEYTYETIGGKPTGVYEYNGQKFTRPDTLQAAIKKVAPTNPVQQDFVAEVFQEDGKFKVKDAQGVVHSFDTQAAADNYINTGRANNDTESGEDGLMGAAADAAGRIGAGATGDNAGAAGLNALAGAITQGQEAAEMNAEEQDRLWDMYTNLQQAMVENPDLMETLMNEVKIFDKGYNADLDELKKDRQLSMKELENSYKNTIDKINLNEELNEGQKQEAIKNATNDYVDTHEDLNFSSEVAYRKAVKTIKDQSENFANVAAGSFLETLQKGIEKGSVAGSIADAAIGQLKKQRREVGEASELEQLEIDMNRKKAMRRLEQQVGTDEARKIVDQAEQDDPRLTNQNLQGIISGKVTDPRQFVTLQGAGQNPVSQELMPSSFAGFQGSGLQGSIQQQFGAAQKGAEQQKQQTETQRLLGQERLDLGVAKAERNLKQGIDTKKIQYVQQQLPYTAFTQTSTGQFKVGQEAKQLGGESAAERGLFKSTLPPGTFQI